MMKMINLSSNFISRDVRCSNVCKQCERLLMACFSSWIGRVLLAIGSFLLLFFMYLRTSGIVLNNGDDATYLLQAYDLIHTSHILQGWYLSADNFITLDTPLYALGLLLGFKMPILMKIIPTFLYTGIILSGIYLASLTGMGKQKILAVTAFLAIVAFPSHDMVLQVLHGPIHMGTILGTTLALIAYYSYKEYSYKLLSLLIMALLTFLLIFGDPMSEVILVLPVLLIETLLLYQKKFVSRSQYFIMGTVLFATIFALYLRHIWGQYIQTPVSVDTLLFNSVPAIAKNGGDVIPMLFALFRGDFFQRGVFKLETIPVLLDTAVVLLLIIGVGTWCKKKILSLQTSQDALIAVCIFIIIADIAVYIFTNVNNTGTATIRYLIPVFVFGGIVAFPLLSYIKKPEIYICIILIFMLNSALFVHMVYRAPIAVQPEKSVITFLKEKHLVKGIGDFWTGAGITAHSEYSISVRGVLPSNNNQLHPYLWLANGDWFRYDNIKDSQFVIYPQGDSSFYPASVGSFGKPDHVYTVNGYTILAWNTPLFRHTTPGFHF